MTKKAVSDELTDHYENLTSADLYGEWERSTPARIEVREPMVSRSVRFPRSTMDKLARVAAGRGIGVTQLIREWTEQRLAAGGELDDRTILADGLERAARLLRESA